MNNITEMKLVNAAIKKCGCMCHEPGIKIMHCMPCCNYTYQKPYNLSWVCASCSMYFDEYPDTCTYNAVGCNELLAQGK